MIPFGTHSVTLYHRVRQTVDGRTVESWQRIQLSNCSWRAKAARVSYDGNAYRHMETICRIPQGQRCPDVGDVLVDGYTPESVSNASEAARLMELFPRSFRVETVAYNADAPLPHYAAKG